MNDTHEFDYGCRVLSQIANQLKFIEVAEDSGSVLKDTCIQIACLSRAGNLERQWVEYGDKMRGCAVGFSSQALSDLCRGRIAFFPVIYDPKGQSAVLRKLLFRARQIETFRNAQSSRNEEFRDSVRMDLIALIATMKTSDRSYESEWRVQVDHEYDGVAPFEGLKGCTIALPICTEETIVEILLGPHCPLSDEQAAAKFSEAWGEHVSVRRLSAIDLL
jgi:hypothetical protein